MPEEEPKKDNKEEQELKMEEEPSAEPQLEKKDDDLKDRLLRLAAEFDNYKKRTAKDIESAKDVGKVEVLTKLLPTLDELELALGAAGKDANKGVEMVLSNFMGALKGLGLTEIETSGQSDPYKHEVILTQNSDKKEGTIIQVVRKGYTLNGIMLRPASVIVSNGKGAVEEKQEEKQ